MAQGGYGQFFKTARKVAKSEGRIPSPNPSGKKTSSLKGRTVTDVLRAMKNKPRTRKNPPVFPMVATIGLLLASIYAYNNMDRFEKLISKIEIRALGFAQAEEKADTADAKAGDKEKSASAKSPGTESPSKATKAWTAEQLAFFNKLEERNQQLDSKEKELQKLEEELQEQKLALEKRLRDLEEIRTKISSRLDEKVKVDQEKVDKLVEFYSNMKPQNAAKVFEDIDEDLAVEILNKMKKKSAADIMNLLKSDKAQKLSEKFAGYKRQ